jgi:hypothetical protein
MACAILRRRNAELRATVEDLQRRIRNMGGPPTTKTEDPYEDEHHPPWEKDGDEMPKVPWGNDR